MIPLDQEIKAYILGALLWFPLGLFIVPFLFISYTCSRLVHLLAKLFHPELIAISKSDALTAFAPSNTLSSYVYTCQVLRVNGIIEVDAFRNHFYNCFLSTEKDRHKYTNLYCQFVQYLGFIFKKRVKQLDLQWHITQLCLQEGVTLQDFVGKWMVSHDSNVDDDDENSKRERPTWMIKVIPDHLTKETTVVFKLHHGICDGYTIVHLVDKLCGQKSPYLFKDPAPPPPKLLKCFIQFPYHCADMWIKMYDLQRHGKTFVQNSSKEVGQGVKQDNWVISFSTLDLETLKQVRRSTKSHFVSVLMSIQMGALRRLLQNVNPNAKVLKDIPLETYIGHSMGWPKHPVPTNGGGMANHLTVTSIKASFHMEDPLERLLDLDKNFRETKSKGIPVQTYYVLFNLMKHLPAWLVRALLNAELSVVCVETGLSTLLASPEKHYLLGHSVENIWLPVVTPSIFPKMKIMTVPVSHSGILDVSINAGASLVKNQQYLDKLAKVYFVEELEALRIRCQHLVE